MTAPQGVTPGPNPPQFDALDADTQIVTFNIGGNDIGFTGIAENCLSPSPIGHLLQGRLRARRARRDQRADRRDGARRWRP